MKASHWGLVSLAIGLVVGMLVGGGGMDRSALAQGEKGAAAQPNSPRFQISAWAYAGTIPGRGSPSATAPASAAYGCYIVDTVTGELWHTAGDGNLDERRKQIMGANLPPDALQKELAKFDAQAKAAQQPKKISEKLR